MRTMLTNCPALNPGDCQGANLSLCLPFHTTQHRTHARTHARARTHTQYLRRASDGVLRNTDTRPKKAIHEVVRAASLCVCMCVCVRMCVYVCPCVLVCLCTCIHTYQTHTSTRTVCVRTYVCERACARLSACVHATTTSTQPPTGAGAVAMTA